MLKQVFWILDASRFFWGHNLHTSRLIDNNNNNSLCQIWTKLTEPKFLDRIPLIPVERATLLHHSVVRHLRWICVKWSNCNTGSGSQVVSGMDHCFRARATGTRRRLPRPHALERWRLKKEGELFSQELCAHKWLHVGWYHTNRFSVHSVLGFGGHVKVELIKHLTAMELPNVVVAATQRQKQLRGDWRSRGKAMNSSRTRPINCIAVVKCTPMRQCRFTQVQPETLVTIRWFQIIWCMLLWWLVSGATKTFIRASKIGTVVTRRATTKFGSSSQPWTTLELSNRWKMFFFAENYVRCHVFVDVCSSWIYHSVLYYWICNTRSRKFSHLLTPADPKGSTNWVRRLNQLSLQRCSKVELYRIDLFCSTFPFIVYHQQIVCYSNHASCFPHWLLAIFVERGSGSPKLECR